jgi:hypothetical protein
VTDKARSLYSQLRADNPEDFGAWIDAHVPADTDVRTWSAVNDLSMMDAMNALADPVRHPQSDFDRAIEFLVAAMNSERIPSTTGIKWLGSYAMAAERCGRPIEHPEIAPDSLGRRILRCLLPPQSGEVVLDAQPPAEDLFFDRYYWPPVEVVRELRPVKSELAWVMPRLKDSYLALVAAEWWDVVRDCG